ncbi:lipopolysaccharide biosynthesis protein [Kaistia granuli]|uniref:lipopolysaccharide biosynthesis protein n=1 Tax=Kaistia granuli TaxID=363259 RepID=UPI0003A28A02|nr:hypothetical protein [Kaistia granuli]
MTGPRHRQGGSSGLPEQRAIGRHPLFAPTANLAIRGMGLAMRLALLIYLARYLGIDAVGQFGLIQGAAGLTPVMLGWGVTYFLGREIVGLPRLEAGRRVRDRLILTLFSLAVAGAACGALIFAGLVTSPGPLPVIAAILALEAFAFDLHIALISVGKPLAANFLLLIRSGAWVVPAALLGIAFPALRTLDFVLLCWLAALAANVAGLWIVLRGWPLAAILRSPLDAGWIGRRIRGGWLIYLNDLALVGMTYLDRYIVNAKLDLGAAGVFVLHWSIANALHVLVSAAIVQVSLPALVTAWRDGGVESWRRALTSMAARVLVAAVVLASLVWAAALVGLPWLLGPATPINGPLLGLMLIAMIIRLLADAVNYGLYSLGRDRALAIINIGGGVASVALSLWLIGAFGLTGTALAMIATALLLLTSRIVALARHRQPDAAIAETTT